MRYKPRRMALIPEQRRSFAARIQFCLVGVTISVVASSSAGCSRKIGDACSTNADCDPSGGTRSCDLSQPGGYCVIEGCDPRSCPDNSICVRFFPELFVKKLCSETCNADEVCVQSDNDPDPQADAVCVRSSLEMRICVQSCGGDGDCRGGYVCRATGNDGALPLTLDPASRPKYCKPAVN